MTLLPKLFLAGILLTVASPSWATCPEGTRNNYKGECVPASSKQGKSTEVQLTERDKELANQAFQQALEKYKIGVVLSWSNSNTGHRGGTSPTLTYATDNGVPCREYVTTVLTGGKEWKGYGTACRHADGRWKVTRGSDKPVGPRSRKVSTVEKTQEKSVFGKVADMKWAGGVYTGEVSKGVPNGQGTQTFPDLGQYVGQFKDGLPHGHGTLTTDSGNTYVGEFKDGELHGQGTMNYASGSKYTGEFLSLIHISEPTRPY
mgnify:CR=1 FL=1